MPHKSIIFSLLLCLLGAAGKGYGQEVEPGASLYVSPDGNDTNPGTLEAPVKTISHAAALAKAGDQIKLRGGIYREKVLIENLHGTEAAPITYSNHNNENVVIEGAKPITGEWVTYNGTWTLGETDSGQVRGITKMSGEDKWGKVVVYPNLTATVLAEVTLNGKAVSEGSMVAAFVGEELRGKREVVLSAGKSYGTLNVNLDGTEQVSFRIWDEKLGEEFEVADSMSLEIGETYGTATALVQLDGAASSKVEIISLSRAPFGFSFKTDERRNYEVEASFDLEKWNLLRQIKGTGEEEKFIDVRRAFYPRQYYRVKETE